jgi:hypothetical protein
MSQIYELHMHTWEDLQALFLKKETVVNLAGELICSRDRKCESKADLDTAWLIYVHDIQRAFCAGKPVPEIVLQAFQTWKSGQSITRPEQKAQEPEMKPNKAFKFSWSPSAIADFQTCCWSYAQKRVYKSLPPEPESEQIIWGSRVHAALEKIAKGQGLLDGETKDVAPYRKYPDMLKARAEATGGTLLVEQQLAITKERKPCDWFDSKAWGRCIIDVALIQGEKIFIADYKTGKKKDNEDQLNIMAVFAALHYPQVQTFSSKFIWLKDDSVAGPPDRKREELLPIFKGILDQVHRMEQAVEADVFPKRANPLCRAWCPVLTCEHNGRK